MDLLERQPFEDDKELADSCGEKESVSQIVVDDGVSQVVKGIADLRPTDASPSNPFQYRNYFAEMPQCIIDRIAKDLDVKSLVRLQSTCSGLYPKCYNAQRLLSFNPQHGCFVVKRMDAEFTVEQFKSTDFRFRCRRLCLIDPVSTDMINSVISCFKGRQVFEFFFIARQPDELPVLNTEPELFNQMLADLEIKEFVWGSLPVYWFELPAVKTLVRLHSNTCPPRLSYLLGSAAHSIAFSFEENEERPDSADMHDILAQWAAGEKEIREYNINNFNVNPVDLIGDWPLVAAFQELPEERPVFVWVGEDVRFRIIRADGEELRVFICGHHNAEGRHLHDISFVDKDHPPFCGSHDHEHNNDEEPAGELHHEDQEHNHDEEPPAEDGEEEEPQVRPGEEEVSRRRQRDCCIM